MPFSELAALKIGSFSLGNLFSALITLLICLIVIHLVERLLSRALAVSKLDGRVQKYLVNGVKLVLYLIATLIVVDSLGIPITSLVALVSVGSLGVTLAAEDILGNVAGGLVILSAHPYAIGDFIELSGASGTVKEISLTHTTLVTLDGLIVTIPNKILSSAQVTNDTALGRRRVSWKVSASYDADTETVKTACREALKRAGKLLDEPAPAVYLSSYKDSSIEYSIYCWCRTEDYWDVYFALGEALRTAFAQAGVEMTYNHLNVHIVEKKE